jgi:hypothetical protein
MSHTKKSAPSEKYTITVEHPGWEPIVFIADDFEIDMERGANREVRPGEPCVRYVANGQTRCLIKAWAGMGAFDDLTPAGECRKREAKVFTAADFRIASNIPLVPDGWEHFYRHEWTREEAAAALHNHMDYLVDGDGYRDETGSLMTDTVMDGDAETMLTVDDKYEKNYGPQQGDLPSLIAFALNDYCNLVLKKG